MMGADITLDVPAADSSAEEDHGDLWSDNMLKGWKDHPDAAAAPLRAATIAGLVPIHDLPQDPELSAADWEALLDDALSGVAIDPGADRESLAKLCADEPRLAVVMLSLILRARLAERTVLKTAYADVAASTSLDSPLSAPPPPRRPATPASNEGENNA